VIAPHRPKQTVGGDPELEAEAERVLGVLVGELPLKQAVRLAVQITGVGRNRLYARALELAGGDAKS